MSFLVNDGEFTQGAIVDNVPWCYLGEEDESPLGIVLTNPCDLEHDKASYILVACLVSAKSTIDELNEFKDKVQGANPDTPLSVGKWEKLNKYLKYIINNIGAIRYFFIDPKNIIDAPPLFVDFQNVCAVPFVDKDKLNVIASLPSPYREKMIIHFSSYLTRIGVDRVPENEQEDLAKKLALPYTVVNH